MSGPPDRVRVQKAMSMAGIMSRRSAEEAIRAGRITIDGRPARLGDRVDPAVDLVEIDGVRMPLAPGLVTYVVNKPAGVISTTDDPQGRAKVTDLVPPLPRVWPVGRLDSDSEGLILLTNDGELTNLVTHPRYGVTKTYIALVKGHAGRPAMAQLEAGIELDDGTGRAVRARILDRSGPHTMVELVMAEGRKREVRRMCDAVGHPVVRLTRTAIGPVVDRMLRPGEWRLLGPDEIMSLTQVATLAGQ